MNIVIHRYNSICEPGYIDAFKSVGIEVIEDKAEMTDKNIPMDKRIEILTGMILENKPLFVFSINFFPYISAICERLGVRYVCVSVDCPVLELYTEQIRNKCNRVFLFDYKQYLDIHTENPEGIFYLPLGVDVKSIVSNIGEIGEPQAFKYDVSFVGSLYTEKNRFIDVYEKLPDRYKGICDGLIASQMLMNGQELIENAVTQELVDAIKTADDELFTAFCNTVKDMSSYIAVNYYLSSELTARDRLSLLSSISNDLKEGGSLHLFTRSDTANLVNNSPYVKVHGGVRTLDEMPLVFRQSRININPTMRAIQTGLPQRIWDVLGAGGFLLTNYQAELPEYFEIGTHLDAYETIDEAIEKIRFYLLHEEERVQIARNGYELVCEKHTVLNRVMEMIRKLN